MEVAPLGDPRLEVPLSHLSNVTSSWVGRGIAFHPPFLRRREEYDTSTRDPARCTHNRNGALASLLIPRPLPYILRPPVSKEKALGDAVISAPGVLRAFSR